MGFYNPNYQKLPKSTESVGTKKMKIITLGFLVWLLLILLYFAFIGFLGYVIVHFIIKWW